MDLAFDRAQCRSEQKAALLKWCGAVMDGAYVRYWPVTESLKHPVQVRALRRMGYFAGNRDWTRGRHWDRRHRYGQK